MAEKAWLKTKEKTYQLFSYAHQKKSTKFLCLYASNFENETLNFDHYVIDLNDDEDEIKKDAGKNQKRFFYKDATDANGLFKAWSETYGRNYQQNGIFDDDTKKQEDPKHARQSHRLMKQNHCPGGTYH